MAYFTGQATSFQDLLNVLVNACTNQGWTYADDILSKGNAFVRPYVATDSGSNGAGLCVQGGTEKSGSSLVNPSVTIPRLGRHSSGANGVDVVFPCSYNIHICTNPDEVYLVVNFSIDKFYYLAFGLSSIPLTGTGLWLGATAPVSRNAYYGWAVSLNGSGVYGGYNVPSGLFYVHASSNNPLKEVIHTGLNSDVNPTGWQETVKGSPTLVGYVGGLATMPHMQYLPSKWSDNAVLLPIQVLNSVTNNKVALVADLSYARYVRIDNFEPNQIIQFGGEQWKIYPFYKKNTVNRDGGNDLDHTGTFGWAIKLDSP